MSTRIMYFNANSIHGKAESITRFAEKHHIDVACTSETWLSPAAAIPLKHPIANITHHKDHHITGGKRNGDGILVNAFSPVGQRVTRHVRSALDDYVVIVETNGVTLIFSYLPPSLIHQYIKLLLQLGDEVSDEGRNNVVIVGDLNARSETLTGDHNNNTRGRLLEAALENSTFILQKPVTGKWTSFGGGGFGITDVVISNFEIRDLVVHENERIANSDHRPLTFSIPAANPPGKLVDRWDVRKLSKPEVRDRYVQVIEGDIELGVLEILCRDARKEFEEGTLGGDMLKARASELWEGILGRVFEAAGSTVGRLK